MTKIILLILFAELWNTTGQVFFKKSVDKLEAPNLRQFSSYRKFVVSVLKIPMIWLGLGFVVVAVIIWLTALAQTELSIAFPIDSMQYIVILVFARIFLGERIDSKKLIGTLLVVLGLVLVALS